MEDLMSKMQSLLSDPESMQQIAELAKMLQAETGDAPSDASPSPAPDLPENSSLPMDPTMLLKMGEMLQTAQTPDKNTALLRALRPHLREERQQKVDRAIRLLQLLTVWSMLKDSGMLQNLL